MVHMYCNMVNIHFGLFCKWRRIKTSNPAFGIRSTGLESANSSQNQGIQVISRAANILRLLGEETDGLSLGQIAKRVELPRSTVQRIVTALAQEDFISTEKGDKGIQLGREIQKLAQASGSGIKDRLRPVMKQISDKTGETVDLAVLEGSRMRFVEQIVGKHRLRTVSSIGDNFPLTTTANGKAALACLEPDAAMRLISEELVEQPNQARPLSEILSELDTIRSGQLARDIDEHTDGVSALGYAITDQRGDVYAISVPVPSSRFVRISDVLAQTILTSRDAFASS